MESKDTQCNIAGSRLSRSVRSSSSASHLRHLRTDSELHLRRSLPPGATHLALMTRPEPRFAPEPAFRPAHRPDLPSSLTSIDSSRSAPLTRSNRPPAPASQPNSLRGLSVYAGKGRARRPTSENRASPFRISSFGFRIFRFRLSVVQEPPP
jgi:hypothetical protein